MSELRRGVFVAFEGGEGAGKTTQLAHLAEHLRAAGHDVVTTREPGGTPTAESIRALLLAPADEPMSDRCEALLFAAARADHVEKVIRPALAGGAVVITDRFIDSSLAYQGFARQLEVAEVAGLSDWATDGLVPDLTVLLDVDPRAGLARARDANRMEDLSLEFHEAVRAGLLSLASDAPERYLVLMGDGERDAIAAAIADRVGALLADRQAVADVVAGALPGPDGGGRR